MRFKNIIINFSTYKNQNFSKITQVKTLINNILISKIVAILFFLLCFNICVGQHYQEQIIGKWMSLRKNVIVEVFKTGNEYIGKIVWFDDSDDKNRPMLVRTDFKNPEPSLRKRKLIGLEVMHGLFYDEKLHEWQDGKIYDASKGKHWNAKAWITKEGILNVRGYWHLELLGQNISFKKTS